jgi:glycosyltransferase involved in cell wall biosynthesis
MQVAVVLEQRFCRTPDGVVWTSNSYANPFWQRYLAVFSQVRIVARVLEVAKAKAAWKCVTGPRVTVSPLPHYIGPMQYLQKRRSLRHALRSAIAPDDSVILRAPSHIGTNIASDLQRRGQPYGVEVIGDPYDVLAPGAVQHPLRPFLRWTMPRNLRRLVQGAVAAAYVTQDTLQQRYPIRVGAYATHYSSIELSHEAFVDNPRVYRLEPKRRIRLISVGSLEQMYKAPDILIEAVAQCARSGVDVELVWAGDGKQRGAVEALARNTSCPERFCFAGDLPGQCAVRQKLDQADIFVLVSRTEGLPKAVIEAMARGLPCIGSTAGGIPELLPEECLVPPNDPTAVAAKLASLCRAPERMEAMSKRNLRKAHEYCDEVLSERRIEMYRHVRRATEQYIGEMA